MPNTTTVKFEELKRENSCQKAKIERLERENEQLREKLKTINLNTIREKQKEIIDIKRQYDEIVKEKNKTIEKNKDEIETLKMIIDSLLDESVMLMKSR